MYVSVKGHERRESISNRSIADVKLIQITIAVVNATNYGKKLKKNQDYGIPLLLFNTLPTRQQKSVTSQQAGLVIGELCETNNLELGWKRSDRLNKDAL